LRFNLRAADVIHLRACLASCRLPLFYTTRDSVFADALNDRTGRFDALPYKQDAKLFRTASLPSSSVPYSIVLLYCILACFDTMRVAYITERSYPTVLLSRCCVAACRLGVRHIAAMRGTAFVNWFQAYQRCGTDGSGTAFAARYCCLCLLVPLPLDKHFCLPHCCTLAFCRRAVRFTPFNAYHFRRATGAGLVRRGVGSGFSSDLPGSCHLAKLRLRVAACAGA